jgi:carboxyl-terminal processing protease
MKYADSTKHTNETKFTTKAGNILYDGGGITPDVFVAVDTLSFDKEVMKALMSGTLNRFVYMNFLNHQKLFSSYPSPKTFEEKYFVDEATLNDLKNYAAKDSIHLNLNNAEQKSQLAKQIKVLTARQIWRTEGFFEINNTYDETVKKALELMGARPLSALIRKHIK